MKCLYSYIVISTLDICINDYYWLVPDIETLVKSWLTSSVNGDSIICTSNVMKSCDEHIHTATVELSSVRVCRHWANMKRIPY